MIAARVAAYGQPNVVVILLLIVFAHKAQAQKPTCADTYIHMGYAIGNVLGNNGGTRSTVSSGKGACGGGGATQQGASNQLNCGGKGGEGFTSSITGTSIVYGSGGGGGMISNGGTACRGQGGTNAGFGGATIGASAIEFTGGGGGGAGYPSTGTYTTYAPGRGAQGTVIVAYDTNDPKSIIATGGTITNVDSRKVHQFKTLGGGQFLSVTRAGYCDILIVAGGGEGGWTADRAAGGGGGGGQVVALSKYGLSTETDYSVFVGTDKREFFTGSSPYESRFSNIIAYGGGLGAAASAAPATIGGSGGGGRGITTSGTGAVAQTPAEIIGMTLSYVSVSLGYSAVSNCAPGSSCPPGSTGPTCVACAAGKYKSGTGDGACSDCGANTYSETVGATAENTCQTCPAGSISPAGIDALGDCVAAVCAAGSTGPDGGPCTACAAGKFKADTGAATCTACGAGNYSAAVGATAASTCLACPASSLSPSGSGVSTNCVCIAGFSGPDGGTCAACVAGKYKPAAGSAACFDYLANSYHALTGRTAASACQCNAGTRVYV
jgi:hypothetical protein